MPNITVLNSDSSIFFQGSVGCDEVLHTWLPPGEYTVVLSGGEAEKLPTLELTLACASTLECEESAVGTWSDPRLHVPSLFPRDTCTDPIMDPIGSESLAYFVDVSGPYDLRKHHVSLQRSGQ